MMDEPLIRYEKIDFLGEGQVRKYFTILLISRLIIFLLIELIIKKSFVSFTFTLFT